MTQFLIVISARVTPLEVLLNAFLVNTCPRTATKTVTNDNSMVLAARVASRVAVEGMICQPLPDEIPLPY
jgi:hypothetical protein